MNIASPTPPAMMAPLHSLLRWLLPTAFEPVAPHAASICHRASTSITVASPYPSVTARHGADQSSTTPSRPLRVVRFLEAGQTPAQVGRMVISGRMSDVCAELDRLAAREAALH